LTKRWRLAFPRPSVRFGGLVFLALLAQILVIYVDLGDAGIVRRITLPLSYVLLLTFVALNWRRLGILVLGLGALLNFLAVVSNGGLMPVSPENLREAGLEGKLMEREPGDAVPNSKDVLLEEDDTHLRFLSDRLSLGPDSGPIPPLFSIGDVIIVAGAAIALVELLLPSAQRVRPDDEPSLT
jgi:hypothetical protein